MDHIDLSLDVGSLTRSEIVTLNNKIYERADGKCSERMFCIAVPVVKRTIIHFLCFTFFPKSNSVIAWDENHTDKLRMRKSYFGPPIEDGFTPLSHYGKGVPFVYSSNLKFVFWQDRDLDPNCPLDCINYKFVDEQKIVDVSYDYPFGITGFTVSSEVTKIAEEIFEEKRFDQVQFEPITPDYYHVGEGFNVIEHLARSISEVEKRSSEIFDIVKFAASNGYDLRPELNRIYSMVAALETEMHEIKPKRGRKNRRGAPTTNKSFRESTDFFRTIAAASALID